MMSLALRKKLLGRVLVAEGNNNLLLLPRTKMWQSYSHSSNCCWYTSSTPTRSRQFKENPYLVLGIPTGSDYDTVKQAFLKAAMSHHPDRQESSSCTKEFIRIRHAFEAIVAKGKNNNNSNNNNEDFDGDDDEFWRSDRDLYPYFAHSTNEFLTFQMDDSTRHEVIRVYKTMSQGGKDRGGYWEMARQLAEREAVHNNLMSGGKRHHPEQAVRQLSTGRKALNRRRKKR